MGCSEPSATEKPRSSSTAKATTPEPEPIVNPLPTEPAIQIDFKRPEKSPHIVIIMVDTLRADRLGTYGYSRELSPNMDRWASEGVVFEQAIAPAPWTLPSIASLFTGFYQEVHGANASSYLAEQNRGKGWRRGIPKEIASFAESLNQAGYHAYGMTTNLFIDQSTGFARGFAQFKREQGRGRSLANKINPKLKQVINRLPRSKPAFLYLHYMDVHEPYRPLEADLEILLDELGPLEELTRVDNPKRGIFREGRRRFAKKPRHARLMNYVEYWEAQYDAGIKRFDKAMGTLEEMLISADMWDDAILVVISDHGEALGEGEMWSHGGSTHQHQLHIPFFIRWPNYFPAAKRVQGSVSLIDLFPTLLDAIGVKHANQTQGRSLLPFIVSDVQPSHPVFAAGVKRRPEEYAVIHEGWKLRFDPGDELVELYHLDQDPHEAHNLASESLEKLKEMQSLLDNHRAENELLGNFLKRQDAEIKAFTDEEVRALQALGYLGGEDPNEDE